ncbi:MAG: hypothetical protein UR60_C0030G0013 [Candidatus Moranbacteria bacterium GW2011_GWF2_34_56]|nr:MAG: hypothetical protein UR51_C0005G0053 [Candidatus Moranbacteria bacterium GW2011_GWF1_34_10]KKP64058.1 MAG: hypothetical protein UR60_C0030G0013 [Candidatus Moranbacteria bacterium GW2011_GWF2_34_56]
MTAEMSVFLHRPLRISLSFSGYTGKDRGIPPSNAEIIFLNQSYYIFEEPLCLGGEHISVNFCDNV